MTDYTRRVRERLKQAGWQFHRQGRGDHEIWINPATGDKVTVVAKTQSRHTANAILKQAGLGKIS